MHNLTSIPQALVKGFILTITLIAAGLFSLEGWIVAVVSFYVVKFVAGLFLPVTDKGVIGFLLIILWLAVSAGFHNPVPKSNTREKRKTGLRLNDDGELEDIED